MSSPVILTAAVVVPWGTMAVFIVKDRMRRRKRRGDPLVVPYLK